MNENLERSVYPYLSAPILVAVMTYLRDEQGFDLLTDVSGVLHGWLLEYPAFAGSGRAESGLVGRPGRDPSESLQSATRGGLEVYSLNPEVCLPIANPSRVRRRLRPPCRI